MQREVISTDRAPSAIGTYSQAVRTGDTVWLSGQIPLDPASMELVRLSSERGVRITSAYAANAIPTAPSCISAIRP